QLAHVADMGFGRVDGEPAVAGIGRAHAHQLEGLVRAAVEEHVVVGHVEVAVVVYPVLLDLHGAGDDGRGNGRHRSWPVPWDAGQAAPLVTLRVHSRRTRA